MVNEAEAANALRDEQALVALVDRHLAGETVAIPTEQAQRFKQLVEVRCTHERWAQNGSDWQHDVWHCLACGKRDPFPPIAPKDATIYDQADALLRGGSPRYDAPPVQPGGYIFSEKMPPPRTLEEMQRGASERKGQAVDLIGAFQATRIADLERQRDVAITGLEAGAKRFADLAREDRRVIQRLWAVEKERDDLLTVCAELRGDWHIARQRTRHLEAAATSRRWWRRLLPWLART